MLENRSPLQQWIEAYNADTAHEVKITARYLERKGIGHYSRNADRVAGRYDIEAWWRDKFIRHLKDLSGVAVPDEVWTKHGKNWRRTVRMEPLSRSCLSHWGLKHHPFMDEWKGKFEGRMFYKWEAAKDAIDRAASAMENRGLFVLHGPTGTGKSCLASYILAKVARGEDPRLDATQKDELKVRVARPFHLNQRTMSFTSLQIAIVRDILPDKSRPSTAEDLSAKVVTGLKELRNDDVKTCLFLDDCDGFSVPFIFDLKRLWTISPETGPLLSIFLCGQPARDGRQNFDAHLNRSSFTRSFANRCDVVELAGLTRDEVWPFVEHKLEKAGGSADLIFDASGKAAVLAALFPDEKNGTAVAIQDVQVLIRKALAAGSNTRNTKSKYINREIVAMVEY